MTDLSDDGLRSTYYDQLQDTYMVVDDCGTGVWNLLQRVGSEHTYPDEEAQQVAERLRMAAEELENLASDE